jgi:Uma2 family endonuclease
MQPHLIDPDLQLPTSEELPCSDDTPVDNENQNTIPNWLIAILEQIWGERQDWFFGVDMGIYNREAQLKGAPVVVPDGFLSVGVQRHKREGKGRLSYVLQEENEVVPILALELVSKTYGQEYGDKMADYARLGVKYYVIYNPEYSRRDKHEPFEVYKLVRKRYQLQKREPFWMPEIELGIGRVQGEIGGIQREWLAWQDREGKPYPLPQELIRQLEGQLIEKDRQLMHKDRQLFQERQQTQQERQRAQQERQRAQREHQRAQREHQRAQREHQRAVEMEQVLEQERLEKLRLLEQLRQLGVNLDEL